MTSVPDGGPEASVRWPHGGLGQDALGGRKVDRDRPDRARAGLRSGDALDAYEAFAPYYDAYTAHHDYEAWTAALEEKAVDAGLRGNRLLDVACGTGKSFLPFLARGYEVTACDFSPAMLEVAREKACDRARLVVEDMRVLPSFGSFDLVTCIDDALNYCLEPEELVASLAGIRRNLDPVGVAVFDLNTLVVYRHYYRFASVIQSPETVMVWDGRSPADLQSGGVAEAALLVLARRPDGWWIRSESIHRQRHYPESEVRAALEAAGLECIAVYGMHLDGSFDEGVDDTAHSKAVYIARRGAPTSARR
jgi:SAM-dependent methyltransferase